MSKFFSACLCAVALALSASNLLAADWTLSSGSGGANVTTTMSDGVWSLSVVVRANSTDVFLPAGDVVACSLAQPGELDLSKPIYFGSDTYVLRGACADGAAKIGASGATFSDRLRSLKLPASGLTSLAYWRNFANLESVEPFLPASVVFVGDSKGSVFGGNPKLASALDLSKVLAIGGNAAGTVRLLSEEDAASGSGVTGVTFGDPLFYKDGYNTYSADLLGKDSVDPQGVGYRVGAQLDGVSVGRNLLAGAPALERVLFPGQLDKEVLGGAFANDGALREIGLAGDPSAFSRVFQKVRGIGCNAFAGCSNLTGHLVLENLDWVEKPERGVICPNLGADNSECRIANGSGIGRVTVTMRNCDVPLTAELRDYGFSGGTESDPYGVFMGMAALTNVTVDAGQFTKISSGLFSGCERLRSVAFSSAKIVSVENHAFYGCAAFSALSLPSSSDDYDLDFGCVTNMSCSAFGRDNKLNRPAAKRVRVGSKDLPLVVSGTPGGSGDTLYGLFAQFRGLEEVSLEGSSITLAGGEFRGSSARKVTLRTKEVASFGAGRTFAGAASLENVYWHGAPPAKDAVPGLSLFAGLAENKVVNRVVKSFGWADAGKVDASWNADGKSGVWHAGVDQQLRTWNPYGGGFVIIGR